MWEECVRTLREDAAKIIEDLLLTSSETSIFRGQGSKWSLLPKALRPDLKTGNHEEALEVFRRECAAFGWEKTGDLIDLAVAQHYGLATHLLDWITNPMVALFFACSERKNEDGEVFILNKQEAVSVEEEKGDKWKNIKGLKLYNPPLVDARMTRQKGLFTVQANDEKPVSELVEPGELEVKLIAANLKKELIELLYKIGIDRSTLFPDLSGLCDRINWETENRITRHFPPVSKARTHFLSGPAWLRSDSKGTLTLD